MNYLHVVMFLFLAFQPFQETSIMDIIGDDGPTNTSEGRPVQEAHVAFSVDGLGNLGTETPKQSPQQPARISCDDKSSFSKATKKLHFRKNLNSMLDELEMETECFLQDTEEPTCDNHLDSFLISEDMLSPLSYSEHELSPVKAGNKHSTKQWEMKSLNEDRDTNFFNVGSSFLDGNIANKKCGLNWKNGDANILRNVSPVFGSGERQLHPRSQEHKTGRYNDLDEGDRLFCSLEEPKYSSFMCNYKRQATCLSPYMGMEDWRDNLTSFSEESCSSTAVRGRKFAGMSSERHVRRYDEDLPWQLNSNAEDNLHEELQDIMTHENRRAEECNRSRKYQRSNVGHTKSAYISEGMLNERFHVEDSWLPESEFPLGNTDTTPGIFIPASWKNRHRSPRRDSFGTTNVQDDPPNTSGCRSGIFEKKTPGEFSPENIPFFQPFCPRQSFKTSFSMGGSYKESSCGVSDNLNIPVQSPNLADMADCFGDTEAAFPELSAQGSVTQEVGDKLKSKSEKIDQNSAQSMNTSHESKSTGEETNIKENGTPFCKENNSKHKVIITNSSQEDAEETSPPVMIQHEFDDELNTKESQRNIPGLCQQNLKVSVADVNCFVTKSVNNDKLKGFEAKTSLVESSCQVMTVERYVFQLFCVSQQKAAVWETTKRLS